MRKVADWTCEDGGATLHFRIKQMSATQAERFTFKILLLIGANGGKFEAGELSGLLGSLSSAPYEKIQELLKETNKKISNFDTIMKDDKASMLFGECSDKLYKLIFNQANSYVNKLKKHEESVNKKAARHAEVA